MVSLLVGGVQKGGTTSLFHYLNDLPTLQMAPVKEVHFFDDEAGVDWTNPDYAKLHAAFPSEDARIKAEATPIYLYWPNSLERIARYNPQMKLVFLFRDPVARAWSHWKMEYARGWETEPFAWAIRQGRQRVDDPSAPGFHRVFSYVERGFYGRQLKRVYELFPQEQVLLLLSEQLASSPTETIQRLADFVGVPCPRAPVTARRELVARNIDYGQQISREDVALLRGEFAEEMRLFREISGLTLPECPSLPQH